MRKAKSLLGREVISRAEGRDLGSVKDLIFDGEAGRLLALLMTPRDLFGAIDATCVPWSQVVELGPDALVVEHGDCVIKVHSDSVIAEAYDRHNTLDGKQVTSDSGENLGYISDLYLDENGYILGYEVSGGLFADAFNGKRYMERPASITHGKDVIIVPHDVSLASHRGPAGHGEEPAGGVGGLKVAYEEARDNIASASLETQRAFVVGKTVARDVIIPSQRATMATPESIVVTAVEQDSIEQGGAADVAITPEIGSALQKQTSATATDVNSNGEVVEGEVLVRRGESVTPEIAERAANAGVMPQLAMAVGESSASAGIGVAREQVAGALSGMQDKAAEAAIGQPAAREVEAPDGRILVAPGLIITREILEQADAVGKKNEVIAVAGLGAVSEAAQKSYAQAKEAAGGLWDSLKHTVEELTGTAQEKKAQYDAAARDKKIRYAIGRPVTRVILAQDDTVILNTGDIITHAAIERAKNSEALDILLNSVFDQEPEITTEMMRATQSGDAALPSQQHPMREAHTATVAPDKHRESDD